MSTWLRTIGIGGRNLRLLGCFAAALATALAAPAQSSSADSGDPPYVLSGAITALGGDVITSFDISFVDPVLHRYYLANRTSKAVIVVDTTTNQVVGQFKPALPDSAGTTTGPDPMVS